MIPEAEVPVFPELTDAAKREFGQRAGYTPRDMQRMVRSPALSMPEIPVAREYLEWFTRAVGDSVPKYGIRIENMEEWRAQYGNDALGRMLHALLHLGRPDLYSPLGRCG